MNTLATYAGADDQSGALPVDWASERGQAILQAAAAEARLVGLPYITARRVAARAGIPHGSLWVYGSMGDIKREALRMDPSLGEPTDRYEAGRAERDAALLDAALALAAASDYRSVTRAAVAERAGVSPGTVSNWAGDMDGLRAKVMHAAVERGALDVIAQGLAARDPIALGASTELRGAAAAQILSDHTS